MKTPKMRQQVERVALKPLKPEHNKQPTVTTVRPSAPSIGGTMGSAGAITQNRVTGSY